MSGKDFDRDVERFKDAWKRGKILPTKCHVCGRFTKHASAMCPARRRSEDRANWMRTQ